MRTTPAIGIASLFAAACSDGGGGASSAGDAGKPASVDASSTSSGGSDTTDGGEVEGGSSVLMTEIHVGDFVFDARVAGPEDGEVVFLLHGFPQTSYEWRFVMPALAEAGYRAVAPDQRGYSPGARPPDVEDYAIASIVLDLVGMADAIGADRFHVVGHDWGAATAWGVAGTFPDRVLTLTALSVPHPDAFAAVLADMSSCQYEASAYFDTFSQPDFEDVMLDSDAAGLRSAFAGIEEEAIDEYVARLGTKEALGAALNWYRANVADRQLASQPLGNIQVPTLFVWGDADAFLCRDGAELTEGYVDARYRFEILEGVGHWIADLAADELNPLLLEHLAAD